MEIENKEKVALAFAMSNRQKQKTVKSIVDLKATRALIAKSGVPEVINNAVNPDVVNALAYSKAYKRDYVNAMALGDELEAIELEAKREIEALEQQ